MRLRPVWFAFLHSHHLRKNFLIQQTRSELRSTRVCQNAIVGMLDVTATKSRLCHILSSVFAIASHFFCLKRSRNLSGGLRENSATNPIVLFIEGGIDSYDAIFDDIKDDEKMYRQVAKNFVDTLKEIARKLSIIVIYIGGPTVSGDSERHPEYLFKYVRTLINLRNCDRAVRFYDVITPDDATNLFTYTPPRAQVPFATSRSLESASAKYPSEVLLYIKKHVVTPVSHLINFCADKIVNSELCRFDDWCELSTTNRLLFQSTNVEWKISYFLGDWFFVSSLILFSIHFYWMNERMNVIDNE